MNWHVVTVARPDMARALGAIRWTGGTVAATKLLGPSVAITYVGAGSTGDVESIVRAESGVRHAQDG